MSETLTKERIRARLHLAKALLEESEKMIGNSPINHPRHEREALVIYLLLTCFDLFGQNDNFLSFSDWLSSSKPKIKQERQHAANKTTKFMDHIEVGKSIFEHYNSIYGVKHAFLSGFDKLPSNYKERILSSITVCRLPKEAFRPENSNTCFPAKPITDDTKANKVKFDFLYSVRNSFTHRLNQSTPLSFPLLASFYSHENTPNASWVVTVNKTLARYANQFYYRIEKDKLSFSVTGWPFILFEALYAAIDEHFETTDINLEFQILDISSRPVSIGPIPHADIPEFLKINFGATLTCGE